MRIINFSTQHVSTHNTIYSFCNADNIYVHTDTNNSTSTGDKKWQHTLITGLKILILPAYKWPRNVHTKRLWLRGGVEVELYFFFNLRDRWGGWSTPRTGRFTGKEPVPTVQETWWALEPVWIGAKNLAPTGIRSPDHPARSESLYRLLYPGSDQNIHNKY